MSNYNVSSLYNTVSFNSFLNRNLLGFSSFSLDSPPQYKVTADSEDNKESTQHDEVDVEFGILNIHLLQNFLWFTEVAGLFLTLQSVSIKSIYSLQNSFKGVPVRQPKQVKSLPSTKDLFQKTLTKWLQKHTGLKSQIWVQNMSFCRAFICRSYVLLSLTMYSKVSIHILEKGNLFLWRQTATCFINQYWWKAILKSLRAQMYNVYW